MSNTTPLSEAEVMAFFLRGQEVRRIATSQASAQPLPETLVVSPGDYQIFGQTYSMREEGLYRFLNLMEENRQCIVFREDVPALLSAISWLVSHGYRDDAKPIEEKEAIARHGKLVITCSNCSHFSMHLLGKLNIPIRQVNMASLENPNGYNDGHTLTEVKLDGRWIVYDPDQGALYSDGEKHLNILELARAKGNGGYQRERLNAAIPLAVGHFQSSTYAYELWFETHAATPELYAEMFNRPLGIPLIGHEGVEYYTTFSEADHERAEQVYGGRYRYLPEEEFRALFYGANR